MDALTHHPNEDLYTDDPSGDGQQTVSCWISELPVNPPDSVDLVSHTLRGGPAGQPAEATGPVTAGPPVDVDVTVQVPSLMHENYRVRVNAPLAQAGAAALAHVRDTKGESDAISLIGADDHVDIQWPGAAVLDITPVERA